MSAPPHAPPATPATAVSRDPAPGAVPARAGALRLGPPLANVLAVLAFLAVPLAASPLFWDQFTSVKWYVLEALAIAWFLVELLLCRSRSTPAFVHRRALAFALVGALVLSNTLRWGLAWGAPALLDRLAFVLLSLCSFWYFSRNERGLRPIAVATGVAAALVDAVGLAQVAGLRPLPALTAGDQRSALFGNVNMTAQFLGFALLFLLFGPTPDRARRRAHPAAAARLALIGATLAYLYFLGCRSVILALGSATVVHLVSRRAPVPPRLKAAALLVAALGAVILIGGARSADKAEAVGQRLAVWKATARMIRDHPLGVGSGHFGHAFLPYQRAGTLVPRESVLFLQPHNEYLRTLAEEGLVVGAIAAALLASLLRQLHRSPRIGRWQSEAGTFLGPALAFYSVEAFFQFPLALAFGSLMAAVLLGLALACLEDPAAPEQGRQGHGLGFPQAWVALGVALAAAAPVLLGRVAASEYLFVNRRHDLAAQETACRLNPRNLPACVTAAWLQARAGHHTAARATLVRSLRSAPYYPPAIKLLGQTALADGDRDAGCRYLWIYDELFGGASSVHARLVALCDPVALKSFSERVPIPYGWAFPLAPADAELSSGPGGRAYRGTGYDAPAGKYGVGSWTGKGNEAPAGKVGADRPARLAGASSATASADEG